ncbi:MAG: putative anti-sigma regulatory factor, serine/threonine protein kinase [Frankiales bacterium]|nr:putative anti-sigma regulatory factor, serine/threonine protein kinase [Frankiales bacterium]
MCRTTARAELLLPATPVAAREAREFARASLCTVHVLELLDDALLLISELVTNSVLHGAPTILVAIECVEDGLAVRVRDGAPLLPRQRQAADADEGGRGLTLVGLLSDAWGVEPVLDEHGSGKVVWFELRTRP